MFCFGCSVAFVRDFSWAVLLDIGCLLLLWLVSGGMRAEFVDPKPL